MALTRYSGDLLKKKNMHGQVIGTPRACAWQVQPAPLSTRHPRVRHANSAGASGQMGKTFSSEPFTVTVSAVGSEAHELLTATQQLAPRKVVQASATLLRSLLVVCLCRVCAFLHRCVFAQVLAQGSLLPPPPKPKKKEKEQGQFTGEFHCNDRHFTCQDKLRDPRLLLCRRHQQIRERLGLDPLGLWGPKCSESQRVCRPPSITLGSKGSLRGRSGQTCQQFYYLGITEGRPKAKERGRTTRSPVPQVHSNAVGPSVPRCASWNPPKFQPPLPSLAGKLRSKQPGNMSQ